MFSNCPHQRQIYRQTTIKMSRSSWKGPSMGIVNNLANNLISNMPLGQSEGRVTTNSQLRGSKNAKGVDLVTYSRSAVIVKEWLGLNVGVHNGKVFIPVFIIPAMIGHKLGEFSRTRIKPVHPKKVLSKAKNTTKK